MRKKRAQKNKGFSLVEFIVILTIFGIMTGVSLFNYNKHQSTLGQSALAQDIALTIRQAQVYGISATDRVYGTTSSDFNEIEYLNTSDGGTNIITDQSVRGASINLNDSSIIIFEDIDRDHIFDVNGDRVIDERKILSAKVGFNYIYLCANGGSCTAQDSGVLDITFQRPYPDAYMNYRANVTASNASSYDQAQIVVSEDDAETNAYVEIFSIGGITVKNNHEQ